MKTVLYTVDVIGLAIDLILLGTSHPNPYTWAALILVFIALMLLAFDFTQD